MTERLFISNDIVVRKRAVRNRVVAFPGHQSIWWFDTGRYGPFVEVGKPKITRKTCSLPPDSLEDFYWFRAICANNPTARYDDTPHYNEIGLPRKRKG